MTEYPSLVWGPTMDRLWADTPAGQEASALVPLGPFITLRLLAVACAKDAQRYAEREGHADPDGTFRFRELRRIRWLNALTYLTAAEVLTAEQAQVARDVMGDDPWPGTLEELVAVALGVTA